MTLLAFANNLIMTTMTSKVIQIISKDSVEFDRNVLGPYFVLTSMLYNNFFIMILQIGKQNRSYLATNQFSMISDSLYKKVKLLENYSDRFSLFLILSFPLNFLATPLVFQEIETYTPLIYLMFILGIFFCIVLVFLSYTTKTALNKQLVGILNNNEKRLIKEPLNANALENQNRLIKGVLLHEKSQFQLSLSNGIYTIIFLALGLPLQYLFHPYNYCSSTVSQFFFIVRPFLLVCKKLKVKTDKIHASSMSKASQKSSKHRTVF